MVTEISGVGLSYPVVGQGVATVSPSMNMASDVGLAGAAVAADVKGSAQQSSQVPPVAGVFAKLQEQQDLSGKAASVVRDMAGVVNQATGLLGKAKQGLTDIVKMFPPYPVASAERVAILNEVSGLRKQVEQLTFPPPESLKLIDQVPGSQAGSTNSSGVQGVEAMVKHGISGLAVLDPGSASDFTVAQALGQVVSLHSKLQDVSTRMWRDVAGFVAQVGSPETQGMAVRQQLASQTDPGIGNNGVLLQQVVASN